MMKEELTERLRKESTYTVQWECTQMINRPSFVNGYITGALPREERLEKEKAKLDYAKVIIQDLLNNSDEYARQRAMDFLKEATDV